MSDLESLFRSIGLLWERLHIISSDTVQTPGLTSTWTRDLVPIGAQQVAAGELVELRVTLEHDHPLAATPKIRFDILEFDWLFFRGFDDPVTSLKTATADPPDGAFTVLERQLTESDFSGGQLTLDEVVDGYRIGRAADFEQGVLVVRENDLSDIGRTHVVAWWRAQHEDEEKPSLYFVADLAGMRDSSTVPLLVGVPEPGASVRITGRVVSDTSPADDPDAQPVPRAAVTLGARRINTGATGSYLIDARLPLGSHPLTISRPGIDTRTLTVRVSQGVNGSTEVALLDADAGNLQLQTGTVPANPGPQSALLLRQNLRARIHRLRGLLHWPRSVNPLPLVGRRVYAVPLAAGPTKAQRPASSRELAALARRPDVLRSARPDRPVQNEATGADGAFELSFLDLRPGSQYLLWVQRPDPRNSGAEVPEVVVRTLTASGMRAMNGDDANQLDRVDRIVVDSTYNLLTDSIANTVEVIRVVDRAVAPAPADVRVLRPGRADPLGIDATPARATEEVPYNPAQRRAGNLVLDVLPLVPVFETVDAQSATARWASRTVRDQLDAQHPRGYLVGGLRRARDAQHPNGFNQPWALRWVLDARRADPLGTAWNTPGTLGLLEETLVTERDLIADQINTPGWEWWRVDAMSLADFASVAIAANAAFDARQLSAELVPVLEPPVPRLTGLFARRHVHVSPGHGLFSEPPITHVTDAHALARQLSARGGWDAFAGEDESNAVMAMELVRVVRANGATWTSSRELERLTLPGYVQTGADAFAAVQPAQLADYPRLWQQNAYYWIATQVDPGSANPIVLTQSGANTATNHLQNRNDMAKNADGINARVALFTRLAGAAALPVDAFIAIHTNSDGPNSSGTSTLYLDIRPAADGPSAGQHTNAGAWVPNPAYVEDNHIGRHFAELIHDEVIGGAPTRDHHVSSYIANGNPIAELRDTVTHLRNGKAVNGIRAHAAGGVANLVQVNFPRVRGRDIPIGYVEAAFHTGADDVLRLAQRWFRHAVGTALARATETMIGEHTEDITGEDVKALLTGVFGATAEVTALAGGAAPRTAVQIGQAIQDVTGQAAAPADAHLNTTVAAIETARNANSRTDLVDRLSQALATVAGYDTTASGQADAIARGALAPLLLAGGAAEPAANAVPTIANLPRGNRPPTRAEAAGILAAGLGLRPANLASVTQPVGGRTLLAALNPERPDAFVPLFAVNALITQAGLLKPVDVYRLVAVRVTDARLWPLPTPVHLRPDAEIRLAIETGGTAWRVGAADVEVVLGRGGTTIATLPCERWTPSAIVTKVWAVRVPAGPAGEQEYQVSVRARHPNDGVLTIGPVTTRLTVDPPGGQP